MCTAQVERVDMMTSPVTFVTSVTRTYLGKNTWFTGGTCLKSGRLIMVDYKNKQLVEIDKQYQAVKEYKIDGYPTDVAAGNNELYIAANTNSVYKCTLNTELTVTNKIKAPNGTWGITVGDDNIIVSTDSRVVIMTQDGNTVMSIPIPKGGFSSYTAMLRSQRTFYHGDGDAVVFRTLEGDEKFRYTHQELVIPWGMCTDTHNNLYVCGRQPRNVHQVAPDRQSGRILLDKLHNIFTPCSVVFNPEKNEFVVTSWNEDTVFEVYRLS